MKLRATIHGARALSRRFLRAAGLIKPTLSEELVRMAPVHSRIMKTVAPKRSRALANAIRPEGRAGGYDIVSPVRSADGFPYTGVTRVGHNVAWIYPNGQALRFTIGGRVIFARRVRGYRPSHDWADDGLPAAQAEAARTSDRIGRRIAAVI